ncbi:MAG: hypothetical protein ACQR33_00720 [Candidatus Saccharibacteria bacterium]
MQPSLISPQGWLGGLLVMLVSAWVAGVTAYPWLRGKGHVVTKLNACVQFIANAAMAAFTCWAWSRLPVNPGVTPANRTLYHTLYPTMLAYLAILTIHVILKVGSTLRHNLPGPWMFLMNTAMGVMVLATVI